MSESESIVPIEQEQLKSDRAKRINPVVQGSVHDRDEDGHPSGGFVLFEGNSAFGDPQATVGQFEWQNGPVDYDSGPNGVTVEAVLEAVIDRLNFYQGSEFACQENIEALSNLDRAVSALIRRRVDRLTRGVLGKHEV